MTTPFRVASGGAITTDIAGHPVAMHYGDVSAEYEQLRSGAGAVDREARGRLRIEGPRAAEVLNGMVTNDVAALPAGRGLYAAALSPKGKIVADVRVHRLEEELFLIDAPMRAHAGWMAMVRKYVNPRLAPHRDVSSETTHIAVAGAQARRAVGRVLEIDARELAEFAVFANAVHTFDGTPITLLRVPDSREQTYELVGPLPVRDSLWSALASAGAKPVGLAAWEIARVEAGRPEWGLDIDDGTIPQEANLEELHAISFTKGCYVGQEVVARIHFRGHVNRNLRGLLCGEQLPSMHATLHDAAGKAVGDVRSAVHSPRLGTIALAMVRREVGMGSTLTARWEGSESRVEVVPLPFP
ncbi:MAG TPA: glycine cleavage T C-terminal barrel domain-containing protein [Gemmatimonadaceae bacterium]|nr:glycine cleavage T C-terminal barrel domain-containing protein [Gemmatimonadaceae bacterium]